MLFFLLATSFVMAQTTNNPFPVLSINYDPLNAPITIVNALLYDQFSNVYDLSIPVIDKLYSQFNYTSLNYLPNQNYYFVVEAKDNNSNPRTDTFPITVAVDYMPIYIVKPLSPLFVGKNTQDFAIGTSIPFNLTLKTAAPAICRIKSSSTATLTPEEEWDRALVQLNHGSTSQAMFHNLTLVSNADDRNDVFEAEPLHYNNLFLNSYLVVCQQNIDPEPVYSTKIIYLGYDTTKPQFSIVFTPSIIEDFSNVSTSMNITTTGDLVACKYTLFLDGAAYRTGEIPLLLTSFEDLFSSTIKEFSFNAQKEEFIQNGFGQQYNFSLKANCTNPAGLSQIEEGKFVVKLTSVLHITLERNYFSTTTPNLALGTNLVSTCWYNDEDNTQHDFTSQDGKHHTLSHVLFQEGDNAFKVFCRSDVGVDSQTFTIHIDSKAPLAARIGSAHDLCESRLRLVLLPPDPEDVVAYNISIYNSTTTSDDNKIYGPILTGFTNKKVIFEAPKSIKTKLNKSYTWQVSTIDQAGNKGPTVKQIMQRVATDSITCDIRPPGTHVDVAKTLTGYEVNISCVDAESGCIESYLLSQIAVNASCNYTQGTSTLYTSNPLIISQDAKLCYMVSDRAGNNRTGKTTLTLSALQKAEINCNNGYQDLDEEGIDCGGVCGSDKPCFPDLNNTLLVNGENNGSNTTIINNSNNIADNYSSTPCYADYDCAYGEICVDGVCQPQQSSSSSFLPWLFIILGILFIAGGIAYIVYSEQQKRTYNRQKALHQQLSEKERAAMTAKRLAEEKKYLEELKRKRIAGEEKKTKLSEAKKEERSKILNEFDTSSKETEEKKKDVVDDKNKFLFTPKDTSAKSTTDDSAKKDQPKLDEGLTEEYVDVEKLGKKSTDTTNLQEKNVFEDLKKLNEKTVKKKDEKEDKSTN